MIISFIHPFFSLSSHIPKSNQRLSTHHFWQIQPIINITYRLQPPLPPPPPIPSYLIPFPPL
ncbi:hypothetical protein Sjap_009042 [Stephania japonica]|uniref:Uncharacterized protein n=1 Tax=Stephania japonica TaxID=461633 RepID=A0AAP0JQP1_9MAGN